MTLLDFMCVANENKTVYVYNPDFEMVASYDGKNSIDEEFNDCNVLEISTIANCLLVTVDC